MEKMLDFKVCLKDIDHHIEDEVKRFELGEDECHLMGVLTKIEQTFPILLQHEYYISWVDQVILSLLVRNKVDHFKVKLRLPCWFFH